MLAAVREHGLDAVLLAVQAALDSGRPSGEHVLNVLSRLKAPVASTSFATTKLQLKEEPAADVRRYETLRANQHIDIWLLCFRARMMDVIAIANSRTAAANRSRVPIA